MNDVVELRDYRDYTYDIEQLKKKLGAERMVIATVNSDGTFGTFIETDLVDLHFVYIIQTLKDRREMRVRDANEN